MNKINVIVYLNIHSTGYSLEFDLCLIAPILPNNGSFWVFFPIFSLGSVEYTNNWKHTFVITANKS